MPTIRRAGPGDAEALVELSAATFTQTFGHLYDPADLDTFLSEAYDLQKHKTLLADPDHAVWLVEDDGALVGYALAGLCGLPHPDVLPENRELKRLYLLADHQQSGLGSTLIELVLDWIGPRTAWLGVWSQNSGAQRFYHRYGFSKASTSSRSATTATTSSSTGAPPHSVKPTVVRQSLGVIARFRLSFDVFVNIKT